MNIGTILVIVLVLALVGVIPTWGYSRDWGYGPKWWHRSSGSNYSDSASIGLYITRLTCPGTD